MQKWPETKTQKATPKKVCVQTDPSQAARVFILALSPHKWRFTKPDARGLKKTKIATTQPKSLAAAHLFFLAFMQALNQHP